MKYEDIAPFLGSPCARDLDLFNKIEVFLRDEMNFNWVSAKFYGGAGGWGNCSTFDIYFDSEWISMSYVDESKPIYAKTTLALSCRGPLLTSGGLERQPGRPGDYVPPGGNSDVLSPSQLAVDKSRDIALKVASEFQLFYLESSWLKQFPLEEKDLTEEASCSLDFSEPTALNILFSEFL